MSFIVVRCEMCCSKERSEFLRVVVIGTRRLKSLKQNSQRKFIISDLLQITYKTSEGVQVHCVANKITISELRPLVPILTTEKKSCESMNDKNIGRVWRLSVFYRSKHFTLRNIPAFFNLYLQHMQQINTVIDLEAFSLSFKKKQKKENTEHLLT